MMTTTAVEERNSIIEKNMGTIYKAIDKYLKYKNEDSYEDIVQLCFLWVVARWKHYNPNKVGVSTFIYMVVRQALHYYFLCNLRPDPLKNAYNLEDYKLYSTHSFDIDAIRALELVEQEEYKDIRDRYYLGKTIAECAEEKGEEPWVFRDRMNRSVKKLKQMFASSSK
jgi:RNA polymerase sigma factor (sigma-70 family)